MGARRQRRHPRRSALPGSQFQGRLPPALPVGPARQRLGRLRSRLLRGRSQPPAEAAPAGGRPSAGSGRRGDGPLCRGAAGRAAPPRARGGTSPTPASGTVGLGTGRHGVAGVQFGWAWRGSAWPRVAQRWPLPHATGRHGSARLGPGSTESLDAAVAACPSPACRLWPPDRRPAPVPPRSPNVTQKPQCHPAAPVSPSSTGRAQPMAAACTLPAGREGSGGSL